MPTHVWIITAVLFYAIFIVLVFLLARWDALNANKKYAQITVEEWSAVQRMLTERTAREERVAQWLTHPASEAFDKAMADIHEDISSLEDEIDAPETEVTIPDFPWKPTPDDNTYWLKAWVAAKVSVGVGTAATGALAGDLFRDFTIWLGTREKNIIHMNYGTWLRRMKADYTYHRDFKQPGGPMVFDYLSLKPEATDAQA